MKQECVNVEKLVGEYKSSINILLNKGLQTLNDFDRAKLEKQIADMMTAMLPENATGLVPVEIPRESVISWLAI